MAAFISWLTVQAADPVFSGPQPGEKTTPFKVLELTGAADGKERNPIVENAGVPTALVFVHAVERSLVPLLKAVDQYGSERAKQIKTEVVFLFADRLEGERRMKAVAQSLRLHSRVGLSLDGAEGPGNYGLNKQCLMTIIAARSNQVTANFALVQPGIADAPKVIAALASACGDDSPPPIEQLTRRQEMAGPRTGRRQTMDDASGASASRTAAKEPFPGSVPADPKLNSLLRQCIRPTNDDATVDRLIGEMKTHVAGNDDLVRQARDGWIRILHFGDHYGTAHARKAGAQWLEELKKLQPAPVKPSGGENTAPVRSER